MSLDDATPEPADESILSDDTIDYFEELPASIASDVRSITAASRLSTAGSASLDARLAREAEISSKSYDAIIKKSQEAARRTYHQKLKNDLDPLNDNHERVQNDFGTETDHDSSFRIDPQAADKRKLASAVFVLQQKLLKVTEQNETLQRDNETKKERLAAIEEQNRQLRQLHP
jgi:hypothetical protein